MYKSKNVKYNKPYDYEQHDNPNDKNIKAIEKLYKKENKLSTNKSNKEIAPQRMSIK